MATIHVSPGAYFEELDYSLYAPRLSKTVPAVIGTFKKGPTETTFVSTAKQFLNLFGTPKLDSYSAQACLSYLEFGSQLWVKRLVGPNATKSKTDLPMGKVIKNEAVGIANGTEYIITGTLNHKPIAGTIKLSLGDYIINDDGKTNFIGSSVNGTPHFIDYDTGAFMFTFKNSNAPSNGDRVRIRYDYVEHEIKNHILTLGNGNTQVYSGTLPHPFIKEDSIRITDTEETWTESDTTVLTSGNSSNAVDGSIDYKSGNWSISFLLKTATNVTITSTTSNRTTFTGTLPFTFKKGTLVLTDTDSTETFTDNGSGVLESSDSADGVDGTINYDTGEWSITFQSALASDKTVKCSTYSYYTNKNIIIDYTYTTFNNQILGITEDNRKGWIGTLNRNVSAGGTTIYWETPTNVSDEDSSKNTTGNDLTYKFTLSHQNIGKVVVSDGSFTNTDGVITIGSSDTAQEVFIDNGDGTLSGIRGGTGTVNYNSGKVIITYRIQPAANKDIKVNYQYFTINESQEDAIKDIYNNGILSGNIEICDNEIDYDNGTFRIALSNIPNKNSNLVAEYTCKFDDIVEYGDGVLSSFDEFIHGAPLMKNSIDITVNGTTIMKDNGEGLLTGISGHENDGNGTINYDTGEMVINFSEAPADGDLIQTHFLRKFGTLEANSEGEWANGIKVQMYKDNYLGYGMYVWNTDQTIFQTPEENWTQIIFDDVEDENYVQFRVASSYINILPITNEADIGPILGTVYTLSGGKDDLGKVGIAEAMIAIDEFSNPETIDINIISCPDFAGNKAIANKLIQICETRYDCFALIDPPYGLTPQKVVDWHDGDGQWSSENSLNSSFAALYYPWTKIYDVFNKRNAWVPPSVKMLAVYAYSDSVSEPWFAPAGLNRGRLFNTLGVERYLTIGERDLLYGTPSSVNPIVDFPADGIVAWGQKTLQRKPSALDRVNVRRLMIYISKVLATAVKYLVFEPNDPITWSRYMMLVEPLLDDIKSRRGLYEFSIKCDKSTNTAYHIDNNEMVAEVWLQPTKVAERIITRFIITNTGVAMSEIVTSNS